jgi:hypothetical protein
MSSRKPFVSIFTYLLAAPHHLVSWLVKAGKPFTLAVSANSSATRNGNIIGETGPGDKTPSKRREQSGLLPANMSTCPNSWD